MASKAEHLMHRLDDTFVVSRDWAAKARKAGYSVGPAALRTLLKLRVTRRKLTQTGLAEALSLSQPATGKMLERLRAQGLVEVQEAKRDRTRHLVLTTAGRNLVQEALS